MFNIKSERSFIWLKNIRCYNPDFWLLLVFIFVKLELDSKIKVLDPLFFNSFISLSNIEEANAGIEKYHNYVYKGKTLKVEYTNNSTKGYKGKTVKNEDEKFYDALYDSK